MSPGNRGGHDVVASGMLAGLHLGSEANLLSPGQPVLPGTGLVHSHHEGEGLGLGERVQVPPAHQVAILPPPRAPLVLSVGDESDGAAFLDRQLVGRSGLGGDQHQVAGHVLAFVVLRRGAGPHVHQVGLRRAGGAVLGQGDGPGGPARDPLSVLPSPILVFQLPELGKLSIPGGSGALGAVEDLTVGRELQDLDVLKTVLLGSLANRLGGGAVAFRAAHPVMESQLLDRVAGVLSRKLLGQGPDHRLGQKRWRLARAGGCGGAGGENRHEHGREYERLDSMGAKHGWILPLIFRKS